MPEGRKCPVSPSQAGAGEGAQVHISLSFRNGFMPLMHSVKGRLRGRCLQPPHPPQRLEGRQEAVVLVTVEAMTPWAHAGIGMVRSIPLSAWSGRSLYTFYFFILLLLLF